MNKVKGSKTDYGYLIKYAGDEFKVSLKKGKWEIVETNSEISKEKFKKLKDLKQHIHDYYEEDLEVPEVKEEPNLWYTLRPVALLALEYKDKKKKIPDYVLDCLNKYGMLDETRTRPDVEAAERELNTFWNNHGPIESESQQEAQTDGAKSPEKQGDV